MRPPAESLGSVRSAAEPSGRSASSIEGIAPEDVEVGTFGEAIQYATQARTWMNPVLNIEEPSGLGFMFDSWNENILGQMGGVVNENFLFRPPHVFR
ncbi:hypothetical protein NC796_09670 [Aliifodinibius sp. S!AR15-10]|uniref:hypothetical protein n=1 Tax=Aliifodinibius sp. S!AR15-10 TaxID=2950437 RepID=UPI00285B5408|nr:hypothetical protein [Aliifodinibius sp. S!AR15-10]MDR8391406.1 hypothetical protein [Aliifodinibius sp. S!AR15-10]